MARLGADVEGLDAVAADLDRVADTVQRARATVDGQLARTRWVGPDADAFRGQWRRTGAVDLDQLRTALVDAARELRRQSDQQRTASGEAVVHRGVGGVGSGSSHAHLLQPAAGAGALGLGVAGMALGAGGVGRGGAARQLGAAAGASDRTGLRGAGGALAVTGRILTALGGVDSAGQLPSWAGGAPEGTLGRVSYAGLAFSFATASIRSGFEYYNRQRGEPGAGARATAYGVYRGTSYAGATKVGAGVGTKTFVLGAKKGAAIGGKLGVLGGPVGIAAGAAVGAVVGGMVGAQVESALRESISAQTGLGGGGGGR